MEERDLTRWDELVRELCSDTSMTNLGRRIGVDYKEVKRWAKGNIKPQPRYQDALREQCNIRGINWKKFKSLTSAYDFRNSYDKNIAEGPHGLDLKYDGSIRTLKTTLFGLPLNSPLGIPASVLTINSSWIEPYTNLGFDILTAKTVRTKEKKVHPLPNTFYVPDIKEPLKIGSLPMSVRANPDCSGTHVTKISLANSFGMPSTSPQEWQADLQRTKSILKPGQILISSVVGTSDKGGGTQNELIADFVKCARLAYDVKPHAIELNFSCPNAYGQEGAVYQDSELAGKICQKVKKELKDIPILIKIGYLPSDKLKELFTSAYKYVDGYTAINTLHAKVISDGQEEEPAFPGVKRSVGGISGVAIRDYALDVVKRLRDMAVTVKPELVILGVGGISSANDVKLFLDAGANAVQTCTAALHNPLIGIEIRKHLYEKSGHNSVFHSAILEKTNLTIEFRDPDTAKAFDALFKACHKKGVNFEEAFRIFYERWLGDHLNEIETLNLPNAPQKTRRDSPTTSQIETWIQDAIKNNRF